MKGNIKQLLTALLAAALAVCPLPKTARAAGETQMDISKSSIIIGDTVTGKDSSGNDVSTAFNTDGYIISGMSTTNTISVTNTAQPVKITLDGVNIYAATTALACALDIVPDAQVILTLADGKLNHLLSGELCAGVHVPPNASLIIQGGGALNAQGGTHGAGIGGNGSTSGHAEASGSITISGGTVWAAGSWCGAGIGGGGSTTRDAGGEGHVTINGGAVYASGGGAKSDGSGGGLGAAIGGGLGGDPYTGVGVLANGALDLTAYGAYEWSTDPRDRDKQFQIGGFVYNNAPGFLGIRSLPRVTISPASGAYASPVTVSLANMEYAINPSITYTLDGTDPAAGQPYSNPFTVSPTAAGLTVRARLVDHNFYSSVYYYSSVVEVTYTLAAPTITFTTNPVNKTVAAGAISASDTLTAAATVSPSGTATLNWYACNGTGTPSGPSLGTGGTFQIPITLMAGTYHYLCQATYTGAASVNSAVATVTVSAAPQGPVITDPVADKPVHAVAGQPVTISVTATNATGYQWWVNRGGGFAAIPGATDSRYTTAPATLANDGYQYYCVVTGNGGSVTSPIFTLSVTAIPATGDTLTPGLWLVLLLTAGAGLAASFAVRRRRRDG